jgi:kinetochore-associated protein 1
MEAFVIIQKISSYQQKMGVAIIPQHFISTVNKKLLKFMLSQKDPEYVNAFIIFRSEHAKTECLEYLKLQLKNNSQRIALSTFSEMYNKYKNNNEFIVDRESRLKLYYYSELCKYHPTLRSTANLDTIGISDFLKDLENRDLPVELLKKLSKDFGWNYQKSLVKQIKIVLRKQVLDYDIKTDTFGKAEVVVKTNIEAIKKQCMPYVTEVSDMAMLGNELEKFFPEINDYFYELFLAVIDLIEYSKVAHPRFKLYKNILLLLKHKLTLKRRSIDGEEHEHWNKRQTFCCILPTISTWRLPFNMLLEKDPEIAISKDLVVETFETYYPLIQLYSALKPTHDINDRIQICALAASRNSVQDMRTQTEATVGAQWSLKPRNNAFLQAVIRMIGYLSDKGKALAILYFIVTNTPSGCDQMEAAFECYKFALAHEHDISVQSKYAEVVEKIKKKYPLLKTQHMLHLYGLADDRLMKIIEHPVLLINALYEHESILQSQKKEINNLCKEVAFLYNIDLMAVQVKLLKTLLAFADISSDEDVGNANETVYEDFLGAGNAATNEQSGVSEENVVRALYILGSWSSSETSLDFIASELSSDRVHTENQLQLFECFAKLVNESNKSYLELVNTDKYLLVRVCHFLKTIGYNYKPATFKDCDKVDLLKKIWTNHYSNPKALEVMSLICIGFNVHLPQIWNGLLKQMVTQKMVSYYQFC